MCVCVCRCFSQLCRVCRCFPATPWSVERALSASTRTLWSVHPRSLPPQVRILSSWPGGRVLSSLLLRNTQNLPPPPGPGPLHRPPAFPSPSVPTRKRTELLKMPTSFLTAHPRLGASGLALESKSHPAHHTQTAPRGRPPSAEPKAGARGPRDSHELPTPCPGRQERLILPLSRPSKSSHSRVLP